MAVNFPSNPTNGQTITVSGITYAYDSTQGVWSDSPQGLTQAIDALTDVDTSTVAPTNGQVLQWNSTDSEWQPADSSAGVTVYATINDLPLSGVAEGSMALVDSTDKLYIFSDAGWYSITLVNTTPSISGVNATYTLAKDGTATVVTVTATDPEGLPLTYSIVSDTSGSIATVTQGTGANTNQWTITPSTNSANAGNFTLVFRASDGVNVASASSTFVLQFAIVNSNYTTALITTADNGFTSNKLFRDSSGNNHTITANGDATQSTFSPYRHGGYSVYCDGNDAVKFNETASDEFTFGTGDFTLEGWFWIDLDSIAASGEHTLIGNNGTDGELWFSVIGSTWGGPKYNFQTGTGSGWNTTVSSSANTVTLKEWVHLAVVRDSGTVTIYENGTSVASGSNTDNIPNTNSMLSFMGRPQTYGQYATGYIHDVRITKGEAVYTSSFTPPTEKLTVGSNTKLLAFRKPYIVDESSSSLSVTLDTGDPTVAPNSPYDYSEYSASNNGGSAYFDGTGDYLTAGTDASLALGSGDFTFECWIYPPTATMANYAGIYSNTSDGQGDSNALRFGNLGTSATALAVQTAASSIFNSTSNAVTVGQWNHVALVRNGTATNNMTIYVNGVASGQGTSTANFSTGYATIGTNVYAGVHYLYSGYIADVRVVQGTAVYTSAFTPPTAPLTAISGTGLLLPFDDATIIDKSQANKTVKLVGNTTISATQTKYLSYSMYFDGTGDYIEVADTLGEFTNYSNATLEMWVYPTTSSGSQNLIEKFTPGSGPGWTLYTPTGTLNLQWYGGGTTNSSTAMTVNQWNHVAVVQYNGTRKIYVNGSGGTGVSFSSTASPNPLRIGVRGTGSNFFNGYMSDIRIQLGRAVYTANFTPPTAALEG
ncbi:MAG: LamG domain-containing protein [Rhodospirillales bacterium]